MGRRRKEQATLDTVEPVIAAEVQPDSAEEQESAPAAAPESVIAVAHHEELPAKHPTKWLVLEDAIVSLFGHVTTLPAGTVVALSSYGPDGVMRIIEQGVMLEPLN